MIGIYKIENKLNGKIYIGQSSNIELRWNQHKQAIIHSNSSWYPEAREESTSIKDFDFSILQICKANELDELEEYWTKYYNSNIYGYNKKIAKGNLVLSSDIQIDYENSKIIFQIFQKINCLLDGKCGAARTLIYYMILLHKNQVSTLPREAEILEICNLDHAQYSRARALLQSRKIITYVQNQNIVINFLTLLNNEVI